MQFTTKLFLVLVGSALICGAVPLFSTADELPVLCGTWVGEGKGSCHPPKTTLYPWQKWKGTICKCNTFYGKWADEKGHYGQFKGKVKWISLKEAVAEGVWTWDNNPSGISADNVAGKFQMNFAPYFKECKGFWTSIYPSTSAQGNMWGKKVD